ncbi:PhzF family phenazine biosynthesis protein [Pasteurella skyensis]|uniref:PhzF family phenazine biosynthesis protein n=1 Tax=Phocoenobacter skyensis TaxID=97481 RepID=A0AAJ6P1T2_9PAST|nr:PhzF family phenazine biosynthesis protein [Pasteurella skyensis]MDP8169716.1 PhzF family phenazine biosynthesis protein [Pasteurella skyensis]MDP8173958.1 PhzF family phenazine biosynthesis protein [Pasteurella skyensis]
MKLEINIVDAFTDNVFGGNPAAVIITDDWLPSEKMQLIASENNLSETAFLVMVKPDIYEIRWFSPIIEIDFCGHATLASAFVLFKMFPETQQITFLAKAVGELSVVRDTASGRIVMNFPNMMPQKISTIPEYLEQGLSIQPEEVYQNNQAYFVIYKSEADVLSVLRHNELLKKLAPFDVVVTCQSETEGYDFISRYFWPANGGDEDPVTGSIHTGLAPLWAERLNKNKLVAYQASQRGGVIYCEVMNERVSISGNAVQYLTGIIQI